MTLFTRLSVPTALRVRRGALVAAVISTICLALVSAAGYFDLNPTHLYRARGNPQPVVVVNFSGDMGLRFLLGASVSRGLTERGIPVIGITTPVLFRRHRTRTDVDTAVLDAVRLAVEANPGRRVVMMGQSYGADVVQTGLAHLPSAMREHIAAIILVLPGKSVFYRADPTGLAYRGVPDSIALETASTLSWAPLTCIYGDQEKDSLCPDLRGHGATLIGMPGDHNIRHDGAGLLAHVLNAVTRGVRGAKRVGP